VKPSIERRQRDVRKHSDDEPQCAHVVTQAIAPFAQEAFGTSFGSQHGLIGSSDPALASRVSLDGAPQSGRLAGRRAGSIGRRSQPIFPALTTNGPKANSSGRVHALKARGG
jgi:hypothetical protein